MAGGTDKYANIITKKIIMSGANTFTMEIIEMGLSLFDKVGLLLSRVEYLVAHSTLQLIAAAADDIALGMVTNDSITTIDVGASSTIDSIMMSRVDFGAAATGHMFLTPIVRDFSGLAGGGLLITPRPWYIAMNSTGLAQPGIAHIRVYFTVIKLADADYFELLETRHFFGS